MRRKECIAVLKESPTPTRWMQAYISIYLIALFVQTAIFDLRMLLPVLSGRIGLASETFIPIVVVAAVGLALMVCTVLAYMYMINLRPSGFGWGVAHLILCVIFWAVNASINIGFWYNSGASGYVLYAVIFFVIYAGGWVVPNYLYFRKRRALFRAYTPREIAYAMGQWHSLS